MEREILNGALGPGDRCLPLDELGRLADGALDGQALRAASTHVETCLHCQSELALLKAFTSSSIADEEADVVREGVAQLRSRESEIFGTRPRAKSASGWMSFLVSRPAFAVATVLLLCAGGFYLFNPASRQPLIPGSGDAMRALAIQVVGPRGDQVEAPARLEWTAASGAARYEVRVTEVDGHEIWSSATTSAVMDIPQNVRALIVPRKTLIWQVTGYDASGQAIAESMPQRFRVVPTAMERQ